MQFRPFSHQFEHVLHEYGRKLERDANKGDAAKAEDAAKAKALKEWSHEDQSIKMLGARLRLRGMMWDCCVPRSALLHARAKSRAH